MLPTTTGEDVRDLSQAIALARLARARGIRHLHAHFATSPATVARLAARFAGLTYSITAHAKDIFHESVDPDALKEKVRNAAAVITVSDFNVAHLRKNLGKSAARVQRIYNGLHLDCFPYSSPEKRPRSIIAVGRLVEKKGFSDLVEACAILRAKGSPFSCFIIGAGELEEALRKQVAAHRLGNAVHLLGPCPQNDVIKHIREAAVLAAPCVIGNDGNRDGLPTVLLEAQALGTPCVSTDVTGIPEVVRHGETGLIVPQRDPAALAAALNRLLDDADLRTKLASKARRLIEREFDVQLNAARLREVFLNGALRRR